MNFLNYLHITSNSKKNSKLIDNIKFNDDTILSKLKSNMNLKSTTDFRSDDMTNSFVSLSDLDIKDDIDFKYSVIDDIFNSEKNSLTNSSNSNDNTVKIIDNYTQTENIQTENPPPYNSLHNSLYEDATITSHEEINSLSSSCNYNVITWYNYEDNCMYFYNSDYNDFMIDLLTEHDLKVEFIKDNKYLSFLKINSSNTLDLFQFINTKLEDRKNDDEFSNVDKDSLYFILNSIYFTINTIASTPILYFSVYDNSIENLTVIPYKSKGSDVGYDLTLIKKISDKNGMEMYTTNISVEPTLGYYTETVVRSSFYKTGYIQMNAVGIIDPGYRGPINVVLYKINKDMPDLNLPCRYGQLLLKKYNISLFKVKDSLSNTSRGNGGFGSTG